MSFISKGLIKKFRLNPKAAIKPSGEPFDPWNLDQVLLWLTPHDPFTIRNACEGIQVFGSIGSGKSSGSGESIAKALLRVGCGGLVLCAKPEELLIWQRYAAETGRSESLIIFSPEHNYRFNYMDYELNRGGRGGGQTENLVQLLAHIADAIKGEVSANTGDSFWQSSSDDLVRSAVTVLSLAHAPISVIEISRLISSAPRNATQAEVISSVLRGELVPGSKGFRRWEEDNPELGEWFKHSLLASCIITASTSPKTATQSRDFEIVKEYWLHHFYALGDRTGAGIIATFRAMASVLSHGLIRELMGTETTNIVPELTFEGAIIVVDLPVQEFHDVGRVAQAIFKYMFQRAVAARNVAEHPRPVFLWCDEAQNFVSSTDFMYQSIARSARAVTVYITQSINNYYSVLAPNGMHDTHALLTNLSTKIFHANGDFVTNQFAADSIGQEWRSLTGTSASRTADSRTVTTNISQTLAYKVQPVAFTTLRTGGPPNDYKVDAFIVKNGVFNATGENYVRTTFTQHKQ